MEDKPIVLVNYGLGSVYSDIIELNYKLPQDLRDKILDHEKRHSSSVSYTKEDFMNDFQSKSSYFKESLIFSLRNPESLINFFPIMYSYYLKVITWNTPAVFPYLYFGLIFSGFFWVLFGINFFLALFGYTIMFVVLNIILLILTHTLVKKDKSFIYKQLN